MVQELGVAFVVSIAFLNLGFRAYRGYLAQPLSNWLLRKGKVKAAMKIRKQIGSISQCSNCSQC